MAIQTLTSHLTYEHGVAGQFSPESHEAITFQSHTVVTRYRSVPSPFDTASFIAMLLLMLPLALTSAVLATSSPDGAMNRPSNRKIGK